MKANTPALLRISWAKPTVPGSCLCVVRTMVCSDLWSATGMLFCQPSALGSLSFCFQGCLRTQFLLGPPWPASRIWLLMNMHLFVGHRPEPLSFLGFSHHRALLLLFCFVDATKITLAPSSADINVGDNLTLQCHASHDPTMELTFTWTLDDFPIDFDKPGGHYRRASVVRPEASEFSLLPDKTGNLRLAPAITIFRLFKVSPNSQGHAEKAHPKTHSYLSCIHPRTTLLS